MDKESAKATRAVADASKALFKPFIKSFSDGTGRFDPSYMERKSKARNEKRLMDALTKAAVKEIKKQDNLDQIGRAVLPMLSPSAKLDEMGVDWLIFWGERASLAFDEDIQFKWAKIFAGEAESPGSFSKWALNAVSCMTKEDIDAFNKLASCVWMFGSGPMDCEVVYWPSSRKFVPLQEYVLDRTGLVSGFGSPLEGYLNVQCRQAYIQYFNEKHAFRFPESLEVPKGTTISLTLLGKELHRLCDATPNREYKADCISQWKAKGVEHIHTTVGG